MGRPSRDRWSLRQAAPGAFFPGAAPGPGWRWRQQPGPRGRWSPMARARIRAHPTIDLSRNDSDAGPVTIEQANAPVACGPAGRGVRASDLNGPGSSQPGPFVKHVTARAFGGFQPLHRLTDCARSSIRPGVQTGAKRPPPFGPLTPSVATRQARPPGRPVQVTRAWPLQGSAGGSRGGAPYGSRPHWWTGCQ